MHRLAYVGLFGHPCLHNFREEQCSVFREREFVKVCFELIIVFMGKQFVVIFRTRCYSTTLKSCRKGRPSMDFVFAYSRITAIKIFLLFSFSVLYGNWASWWRKGKTRNKLKKKMMTRGARCDSRSTIYFFFVCSWCCQKRENKGIRGQWMSMLDSIYEIFTVRTAVVFFPR